MTWKSAHNSIDRFRIEAAAEQLAMDAEAQQEQEEEEEKAVEVEVAADAPVAGVGVPLKGPERENLAKLLAMDSDDSEDAEPQRQQQQQSEKHAHALHHCSSATAVRVAAVPPPPATMRSLSAGSGGLSALLSAATGGISVTPVAAGAIGSGASPGTKPDELIVLVRKLCQRQRLRSEERAFVRDVEHILALLQRPAASVSPSRSPLASARSERVYSSTSDTASSTFDGSELAAALAEGGVSVGGAAPSSSPLPLSRSSSVPSVNALSSARKRASLDAADMAALFDCIADLFDHRNADVRALAFEVVILCTRRYGASQLPPELRRRVFRRVETHKKDFQWRQAALRALTDDGRDLEPFRIELGWLLLQLLEQSTAQHDLLLFIQDVLHQSPGALGAEAAMAVTNIICARCDHAWSRGEIEACKRYFGFFHVLAVTSGLELVASSSGCLRSLCYLVNADGHGTWSIMKLLLNGAAGFHVLRGLLHLLENPQPHSQWVLRGAVFFVGMSCWGSQRIAKFDDVKWAPALLSLESVLECNNGVVVFEVILALQRLIKKFGPVSGDSSTTMAGSSAGSSGNGSRRIVVEWSIILRMFHVLRPWLSMIEEEAAEAFESTGFADSSRSADMMGDVTLTPGSFSRQRPMSVTIQQTRMPKELLDTLALVEDLVARGHFAGDAAEFFQVLEEYLPHLSTSSKLFLLRYRADAAHPGYDAHWIQHLASMLRTFFVDESMPADVRLEALGVLETNLAISRHVSEDRVIEDVLIPTLDHVYDDPIDVVRFRGVELLISVARHLDSMKFELLLDILATAVTLAQFDDAQEHAIAGIASLFASWFDHLPSSRALRMYEILTSTLETHRNWRVRHSALSCLLCVCEATSDFHLQWKDCEVNGSSVGTKENQPRENRRSRFLFCSRAAVPRTAMLTGSIVPIGRGLRALLTLVSTETNATLFRMAVSGLQRMLANRSVLSDVDISEVALKVISSISYRAFGRTAVTNEAARLLRGGSGSIAETQDDSWEEQTNRVMTMTTDAEMVRCIYAATRHQQLDNPGSTLDVGMLSAATLLSKTSFLALGMETLALVGSYATELRTGALQQLVRCFLDAIGMSRVVVAEKDFFGEAAPTSSAPEANAGAELVVSARNQGDSSFSGHATVAIPVPQASVAPGSASVRRASVPSADIRARGESFASESALGFTARVFSRFHPGTTPHGGFFHSFSGSGKSGIGGAENRSMSPIRREKRARMNALLRQLFAQESKLIHIAANTLSLLAFKTPSIIDSQVREVVRVSRPSFMTSDGDFRADVFAVVVEMLGNLVSTLRKVNVEQAAEMVELLLLGFEYATSRHVAYLSFRLLCQVISTSSARDRIRLASIALPALQQCAQGTHSLLIESAIDFLLCHAYSRSSLTPAALCNKRGQTQPADGSGVTSRTWMHKNTLLTISISHAKGTATLTVRRATWTSTWRMNPGEDMLSDPNFADLVAEFTPTASKATTATNFFKSLHGFGRPVDTGSARRVDPLQTEVVMARSLPTKSTLAGGRPHCKVVPDTREGSTRENAISLDSSLFSPGLSSSSIDAMATPPRPTNLRRTVSFPSSSFPPLPAYDGVGGSPSYFVDGIHGMRGRSSSGVTENEWLTWFCVAIHANSRQHQGHTQSDEQLSFTASDEPGSRARRLVVGSARHTARARRTGGVLSRQRLCAIETACQRSAR